MEHETHKQHRETDRTDLQTASLFFILALLTGLFVLAFKWAVLTPNTATQMPNTVESATKKPGN
jgi:hypothetical protein